jgi:hypothetical protein
MRQLAAPAPGREGIDQRRQVLARLDRADVEDDPLVEAVAAPHAFELGRIVHALERGGGRLVHDVHAARIQVVVPDDVVLGAFRHRDDRVGAARGDIDQRPVEQHAPGRGDSADKAAGSCRESSRRSAPATSAAACRW